MVFYNYLKFPVYLNLPYTINIVLLSSEFLDILTEILCTFRILIFINMDKMEIICKTKQERERNRYNRISLNLCENPREK